jgi:hypothetical protein
MKLAETDAGVAKDIAASEAKLTEMEARATESSVAAERHFDDICTKLVGELAPLCEACEHNIQSLECICSLVPSTAED